MSLDSFKSTAAETTSTEAGDRVAPGHRERRSGLGVHDADADDLCCFVPQALASYRGRFGDYQGNYRKRVEVDDQCRFGSWMYSHIPRSHRQREFVMRRGQMWA